MITEDYVSFETAKLLKERGFDEKCFHYYEDNRHNDENIKFSNWYNIEYSNSNIGRRFAAPTLQMAMKWLREVYYLHITVHPGVSEYGFIWTYAIVFAKDAGKGETHFYKISQITTPIVKSKSYEEAAEAAIKHCLEKLI